MNTNKTKKIILLNGPISSGKDYGADYLVNNLPDCKMDKFARVLKERTHALYGFPYRKWDHYEDCKDIPNPDFFGKTPRQAYIGVSETYFKPMHGESIFGEILAKELDDNPSQIIAISDSGFVEEAEVLIDKYGASNVMLFRIHKDGCNFNTDSRNYIVLPVHTIVITNLGDDSYTKQLYSAVTQWLSSDIEFCNQMKGYLKHLLKTNAVL